MFTKALFLVLLGTSLVLADRRVDEFSEQQVDKTWREKVNEFLHKVEAVLVKYFQKGKESLDKILNALKQKGSEIAEVLKVKWANLQEKYREIKDKVQKAVEEKKAVFLEKVAELKQKGKEAAEKVKEYAAKAKVVLGEEYAKLEANLKEWLKKVKETISDVRKALQEKSFDEILNEIYEKFGDYVEIGKEKFAELKKKYYELKEQAKLALTEKKKELENRLKELKENLPEEYEKLKGRVSEILAAEKAKWTAKINDVKEQIQKIIQGIKEKISNKAVEHKQ